MLGAFGGRLLALPPRHAVPQRFQTASWVSTNQIFSVFLEGRIFSSLFLEAQEISRGARSLREEHKHQAARSTAALLASGLLPVRSFLSSQGAFTLSWISVDVRK